MTAVEFPPSLFTDPTRALRTLHTVHEIFIASGSYFSLEELSVALHDQLINSPDPDMAVTNLLRFTEATVSKASLFNDLLKYPVTLDVLFKVFGYSQYLADILVRDTELFRWLTASDVLMMPQTKESLASEVQRIEGMFVRPEKRLNALRRLYRREFLRIGAKDILGNADLATVTQELSDLADTLIDAACRLAELSLREKYGDTPETPYAVIGLGKLGGTELNYSSDIDIIFVYEDEGDLPAAKVTYHEYFNRLVERLVQNLSQTSSEGHMYRVDTRLRPESGMGPLARSVQSYLLYYESRGELWERQMLIKARAVAGDVEFGERFLKQLIPFIYPRTFFTHPKDSIARIKARIEGAVAGEDNVKLQAGGIRDIEFIVQALQLLNGGKNESVRSRNTLHTIALLTAEQLLSSEEDTALTDAYVFFRTLEHRLQTLLNTQTHSVPSDWQERTALAKRLGLSSAREMLARVDLHRNAVRKIYDAVLKMESGETPIPGIEALIEGGVGEEEMVKILARYGFRDTHRSGRLLRSLVSGNGLTPGQGLDARARSVFRLIAGEMFREISQSPSPDLTLSNLSGLIAAQKFAEQFLGALKEESFRKLIFAVCGVSSRLTRGLAKDKLLLELLASNSAAIAQPSNGRKPRSVEQIVWKQREELRACIRYVLGMSSFKDFTDELSGVADEIVRSVFQESRKKFRTPLLAVFALGKYGTRELTLDADLDLVFIADQNKRTVTDKQEKVASLMIQKLTGISEMGRLYNVDARLRPEGRSAPLVVDRRAHTAYLSDRASLWERQSLTRLRFVCGDEPLGKQTEKAIASFVYDTPLPPAWTEQIVTMRRKMERRSHVRSSGFVNIKLGPGGMVDVEFVAQMIQMRFGGSDPMIRHLSTAEVLRSTYSRILSPEQESSLQSAYELYRRIELMMRLVLEECTTVLPEGEKSDLLARILGVPSGEEFRTRVVSIMKNVRAQFLEIARTLSIN